ncbi:MAG: DNA repair protein RecO [Muribaculaceae bacterium]|nr:DNA repair protein RecO [Muribaculaceae bacterium]
MFQTLHAVALRTVKYNDRSSILTAWSAELGRVALLMPSGSGAESRRRRALTMPLSLFEGVVDVRPGRDIMPVSDVKGALKGADLGANPIRATVAMFLAEVLTTVTREGGPDMALWRFLEESVGLLVGLSGSSLANFHLVFLTRLAAVMGLEPDMSTWSAGKWLDLADGVFRITRPMHDHVLDPDEARVARILMSFTDYGHLGNLPFTRETRRRALDVILRYYTLHHSSLDGLRSLPVVRATL